MTLTEKDRKLLITTLADYAVTCLRSHQTMQRKYPEQAQEYFNTANDCVDLAAKIVEARDLKIITRSELSDAFKLKG